MSLVSGGVKAETRQVLDNLHSVLSEAGLQMSDVVQTTIYLADLNDYTIVNAVYAQYFSAPYPSRAAVEVSALPKGAGVEISCIAVSAA